MYVRSVELYAFKQYTTQREKGRKAQKEVDWVDTSSFHSESDKAKTEDRGTDLEDE